MLRRPGDDRNDHENELEQSVNLKLRELLAKKKEQDLEGASARTRGHATRVLRPRLQELREMVVYGLSMREMTELLADGGVQINYHSLRAFLKKHLPREYAEYLESKKPNSDPYFGSDIPPEVLARDTPPEFASAAEATAATKEIDRPSEQRVKAAPVEQTKPAGTEVKKPPLTTGALRALTEQQDYEQYRDADD